MAKIRPEGFVESVAADLRGIVDLLYGRKHILVTCTLAAGLLGWLHLSRTPNIYSATAVLEVEKEQPGRLNLEQSKLEEHSGYESLKTIENNLTGPSLLLRVIEKNKLLSDPGFLPDLKRPVSGQRAQRAFASAVTAQLRNGTRLIDVSVEDRNPAMAQHLANLLVDEFIQWNREVRAESAMQASEFLVREALRLQKKLNSSEQALQSYKEQHHAVSLEEKQNIVVEKLRELNTKVTLAKAERLKLEADKAQIKLLVGGNPERLLELPSVSALPGVVELKRRFEEQAATVAMLSERYKPGHPKQAAARSQLEALRTSLHETLVKSGDLINTAYEAATVTENKLQQALVEQEQMALELNKLSVDYHPLVRELETDKALFESVSRRLKEAQVSAQNSQSGMVVASRPLLPELPVKPRRKLVLLASLILGTMVGAGTSALSVMLDRRLRSLEQAQERLGLAGLGAIPKAQAFGRGSAKSLRQVASDPFTGEAFKSLRTGLTLLSKEPGTHSLLMVSAEPFEGKSFCAMNMAVAFAQAGLKTLLLDADLRNSGIASHFKANSGLGVGDYLAGGIALREIVQSTECRNLDVVLAGKNCESPSELLAQGRFEQLLEEAGAGYERIVIDSPALEAVSDALLMVRHVQAVCLVVDAASSQEEVVARVAERLRASGAPLAGFILNRAQLPKSGYRRAAGRSMAAAFEEPNANQNA